MVRLGPLGLGHGGQRLCLQQLHERTASQQLIEGTPEMWEHSVEAQVPFLQKTLTYFKIVPVIFGEADPEQVAKVLVGQIDARRSLWPVPT